MKINSNLMFKTASVLTFAVILMFLFSPTAFAKIRFNVGFTTDQTLESPRANESWQYTAMGCAFWPVLYDQLWILGPAPDYKILPRLATHWETKDRKTWRFYLNKDANFHDGKPVTAHDVAFTMTYLPKSVPTFSAPDRQFDSLKVIDDYTIEFKLVAKLGGKYPPCYWMPILPSHIWESHKEDMQAFSNSKAVGSGPYKLKEFKSKQYVWFEANKEYWGGAPAVDELVYKAYGGQEALNLALKKGEVEMIGYFGIQPINVPDFQNDKNMKILVSDGIAMTWLTFNLHKPSPIQDLTVRKAIMHGINLNMVVDLVYQGYAKKVNSFIYPELPEYNPNLPEYDYNPEKAKQILEKAGYVDKDEDGIRNDPKSGKNMTFDLIVGSDWIDAIKTANLLKNHLKEIGVDVAVKALELDTYYSFVYAPTEDKWDFALGGEEPGPYADWIWELCRSHTGGGAGWNQSYYNNPRFDELLNKLIGETDLAKRKEYSFAMQQMIAEELPYGIILRPDIIDPVRTDRFEGYVQTMGGVVAWINPWTFFNIRPIK